MNHPKSFKKCSVTYEILQNFTVFQPGSLGVIPGPHYLKDLKEAIAGKGRVNITTPTIVPQLSGLRATYTCSQSF